MDIIKFSKFFEAKLEFDDLKKSIDGKLRVFVLIDKLKNKKPLEIDNGKKVIIDKILDTKSGQYVDIDSDVNPISQIVDENGNYLEENAKRFFNRKKVFLANDGN